MTQGEKFNWKKYIVFPASIIGSVVTVSVAVLFLLKKALIAGDLSNGVTFTIELGIAVFISVIVFFYSKFQQDRSEALLKRIKTINEKMEENQNEINSLIQNTDEIVKKQSEILELMENRRRKMIGWFVHHVGGVLKDLRNCYQELYDSVEVYQKDKTELNLKKTIASAHSTKDFILNQLKSLAERDIDIAKDYISNPWILGKFRDVISLLGWVLDIQVDQLRSMDDMDLIKYKEEITRSLNQINQYIEMVENEGKF